MHDRSVTVLRTLKRSLAVGPAVLAMAGTAVMVSGAAANAAANPGPGFPAHFSAPYVETWNSPSAMTNALNSSGTKYFTLAFVIDAGGCNAKFNGSTDVTDGSWTSAVNAVRAAGGDVMVSFGGASGTEEAVACSSVSAVKAQYKKVIDALNLTRVDFDIESGQESNTAANTRRDQALAQLQQEYAAAGKNLQVQYTLGTDTSGLPGAQLNLLRDAKAQGVNVSLVNPMTMDYGRPVSDMGQAAIDAANALHGQLGSIWTDKSAAQLWAMEGNTPMLGANDTPSETFTTANATAVLNFAKANGIQELSFWALGRDRQCGGSTNDPSNNCSGTSQSTYQFSTIFNGINGGGTTTPPPGGGAGQITGIGGKCVDVNAASSANGTAVQLYDCNGSGAQSWTVGSDGTLRALGKCMDVAAAGTADGTKVQLYDCNGTAAQKWSKGSGSTLVNQGSGKCLDATDNSSANLTRLQIWQCFGGSNQQWHLPA
ncbi:ricin-type beta-trefoil lectin domain protein [Streptomyces sp. NPDC047002]|uniref:ricin-type beta-trefoil lectin domain protein n=1 Tax=Streptomyces sp. NPDC047002 TaxID=3155475 RepID=UPI0034520B44